MGYTVYKHIFPNGKVYIGITKKDPRVRWGKNGYQYHKNKNMWNDIQKYGWNNIQHIILYTNKTAEEASKLERELIQKAKSNDKNFGYNIQLGGLYGLSNLYNEDEIIKLFNEGFNLKEISKIIGCCARTASEILRKNGITTEQIHQRGREAIGNSEQSAQESNKIMLLFKTGKTIHEISLITTYCYSKIHKILKKNNVTTQEIINQKALIKISDKNNIATLIEQGYSLTDIAFKYNCSSSTVGNYVRKFLPNLESQIQHNRYQKVIEKNGRKVNQYTIDGVFIKTFPSINEASRSLNVKNSHIGDCCNKIRNSALGFIWRFDGDDEIIISNNKRGKPVAQYTKNGVLVKAYDNAVRAYEFTGINKLNINQVCRGEKKTAGGFIWKYI